MSDGLPKPSSIEVGQWWLVPEHQAPHRVESIECGYAHMTTTAAVGPVLFDSTLWPIDSMSLYSEYLGSGEHPEPTAWMIGRLIEHGHYAQSGAPLGAPRRATAKERARELLQGAEPTNYFDRAVVSLYRILRDLGKW